MANRFYDNYRPPHSGQNVLGDITPNRVDTPYYEDGSFDIVGGRVSPKPKPYSKGFPGDNDYPDSPFRFPGDNDYPPGGAVVPRKPKPSKPSGGMKLPLPTKVGQ